jgi:hypothetical protein
MNITIEYDSLKRAIQKHPNVVAKATKDFLYRAGTRLESQAGKSPWRVGGSGGGVPVDTGNLLKAHQVKREPFRLTYGVEGNKAPYAWFVHQGTRNMDKRPWLEWTAKKAEKDIQEDGKRLLKEVTDALGK